MKIHEAEWLFTGAIKEFGVLSNDYNSRYVCSNCGYDTVLRYNYCPECGAKMKIEGRIDPLLCQNYCAECGAKLKHGGDKDD